MNKTLILAAALLAVPTAASASERRFTHDGVTYVYTSAQRDGLTVISGKSYPGGAPYTLNVRGQRVTGRVAGTPVMFRIAKPLTTKVETAAR